MHKFLMKVECYFSGWKEFTIEAENKQEAITKATEYCKKHPTFSGYCKLNTIQCIKKLKG